MKNRNALKRVLLIVMVLALPMVGWVYAQQNGKANMSASEGADTSNLPQTKTEKIEYFQELRETCLEQGNTAAVEYCDWALGFLEE